MRLKIDGRLQEVSMFYILDENGEPQEAGDLAAWAEWWGYSEKRRVVFDELVATDLRHSGEDITVSTVFLGIDHNFHGFGNPVLYETLVLGGPMDEEMDRYTSREEAIEGHAKMLAWVKTAGAEDLNEWLGRVDEEEAPAP